MNILLDAYINLLSKFEFYLALYKCPFAAECALSLHCISSLPPLSSDPKLSTLFNEIHSELEASSARGSREVQSQGATSNFCECVGQDKENKINENKSEDNELEDCIEDKQPIDNQSSSEHHSEDHSNEYECRFCHRKFKQKGNMNKHLKQHLFPDVEQRKNFKCDLCGCSYTERYNLKAHMQKKHPKGVINSEKKKESYSDFD